MRYFKSATDELYAYGEETPDGLIKPGLTPITTEEAEVLRVAQQPPPLPLTCTPWQMRKALNQMGLRTAVENYVAAADQTTKDGWEFATEFREDDAFVAAAQAALGMTNADRTNLFTLARTL